MTDIAALPDALRDALPADVDLAQCEITTLGALAREHDIVYPIFYPPRRPPEDAPVVILPGYIADDGEAEVEYPEADTAEEAARSYVDEGSWDEDDETDWVDVSTRRVAYAYDPEAEDAVELIIDPDRHRVAIER